MPTAVGLIGCGLLGSALAERLMSAGYQLIAYDLDAARVAALSNCNVRQADSAAEVVAAGAQIIFCLPTSDVSVATVATASSSWHAGQTVIDTTTGAPDEKIGIGKSLAARGVGYLDVTVAGSSAQMRCGEAALFVGGDEPTIVGCRPRLNRAALAEGLSLALALGFDAATAVALLKQTPAYSTIMDTKGLKMARRDFSPQATVAQHLKDVRLILAAAQQAALDLRLSTTHAELLQRVIDHGLGAADNSAVITAYDKQMDGK
jgi:3-hydroxyisobutyrate dehydrogenase-like beta-hydroxyacid dehydrogenase